MAKAIKTNVLRHLDALKIPYETREYTVDDDNFDGKLVAEKVDLPAEMIYKTLVLVGDTLPHLVCVIPVELELDLKAVARAAGCKSVHMLPQKDLLPLTGYLRGGSGYELLWTEEPFKMTSLPTGNDFFVCKASDVYRPIAHLCRACGKIVLDIKK